MNHKILKIHAHDNVLVALTDLKKGDKIQHDGDEVILQESIKAKHKFAQNTIAAETEIIMYGNLVGKATTQIKKGTALTIQNVSHHANTYSGKLKTESWAPPNIDKWKDQNFLGYHRKDGQVGTANYWIVIPLVFCENRNVETMKQAFLEELGFSKPNPYKSYVRQMASLYKNGQPHDIKNLNLANKIPEPEPLLKNIDGIKFLTHQGGCGGIRQDSDMLCALIAGYINNPNVAGATILSLGCQNAQISILRDKLESINPNLEKPLFILEQQQEGTEQQMLTKAIQQTFMGLIEVNKIERTSAPLSKLTIGLECGGSDGFSGISANPAVGQVSDLLVALGGKTMLAEFPELCGVEQELINRCTHQKIADKFIQLMQSYAASAEAVGSGFDMNPSPGNIKDGLITDAMKSAGAAKKGGTSPVVDVLDYAEYAQKSGLNLLCTPGNDVESTTALAGSGANLIVFTTGLGTPTGNPIAPVIKISSNSSLAERMPDIIDVDTGGVINGTKTIKQMGEELLNFVIQVASGTIKTKAQKLDQDDFIPWKRGISL
ncbi:altronate dehydratase family protein [Aquimarina gracilis]|uniref:Altronate dehydratase family protein n=1 Tax=Aquimarina gracilis TaxID=874422 RepID=A0ABU5ZQL8_9FLAO|nr:altronate dehydratase family protein [Aquimarina gracilis]MEB3344366.1 altronate dehydratase family protein [Aquimarina gracilis]